MDKYINEYTKIDLSSNQRYMFLENFIVSNLTVALSKIQTID